MTAHEHRMERAVKETLAMQMSAEAAFRDARDGGQQVTWRDRSMELREFYRREATRVMAGHDLWK